MPELYPQYKDILAIIADVSIRTGKTMWTSIDFISWSMTTFDEANFGMAGKTIASLRCNVISPLISRLKGMGYKETYKRSENMPII